MTSLVASIAPTTDAWVQTGGFRPAGSASNTARSGIQRRSTRRFMA